MSLIYCVTNNLFYWREHHGFWVTLGICVTSVLPGELIARGLMSELKLVCNICENLLGPFINLGLNEDPPNQWYSINQHAHSETLILFSQNFAWCVNLLILHSVDNMSCHASSVSTFMSSKNFFNEWLIWISKRFLYFLLLTYFILLT